MIAEFIRRRRKINCLSQQELADLAKTTQTQISKIERGEISPTFETITRLLDAMDEVIEISSSRKSVSSTAPHILYNPPRIRKKN